MDLHEFNFNVTTVPTRPIGTITSDGNLEGVQTYNQPIIKEPVMLGDFFIRKIITSGNASEIVCPEVGAEFTTIYKGYVDKYSSFEEALKYQFYLSFYLEFNATVYFVAPQEHLCPADTFSSHASFTSTCSL